MGLILEYIGSQGKDKRPKDFPKKFDDNMKAIIKKFNLNNTETTTIKESITEINTILNDNGETINQILQTISTNEQNISSNSNLLTILNNSLTNEIVKINNNTTKANSNSSRLNIVEATTQNHATSIADLINQINNIASPEGGVIGDPEDGTFSDGLFSDLTNQTLIGTAIDKINEVLKSLAPPQPNILSIISSNSGISGKLSFGESNNIIGYTNHPSKDVDSIIVNNTNEKGIFNGLTTIEGTLASSQSSNLPSFPAYSFSNGNKGLLILKVNDIEIHSVDLTTFNSGSSLNGQSSGFTLSLATSVKFSNGDDFDGFKYRTGSYRINSSSQRNGYNYCHIIHRINGQDNITNNIEWINDSIVDTCVYSSSISNISMLGSAFLSGVEYYTSGTAQYNVSIQNAYKNTYSNDDIYFDENNIQSVSDVSIPSLIGNTQNKTIDITKTIVVSKNRMMGEIASIKTITPRSIQSISLSPTSQISQILMDKKINSNSSTLLDELMDDETKRIDSEMLNDLAFVDYATDNRYSWSSEEDLNGNDGLMLREGKLIWPFGNYNYTNGPVNNADYTSINSGTRSFYRWFSFGEYSNVSDFKINIESVNTDFVNTLTTLTGNRAQLEIFAPNTTTISNSLSFKDAFQNYLDENTSGCYAANITTGSNNERGYTLGTKSTYTSKGIIIIRITTNSTWSGSIERITCSIV